ncbi:spore germination protein GerW family protein [Sphaerisporangium corydalis]|uniref:Spore germination protein GerW family protein n=1 Tax=Sphaerisporangium corydalis TaxID=1441875 RepID=A0ABV9EGZ5_9ACTN|nr:spore germination protein GerW family protein [Sphaerisporangium corydalis]
MDVIGMIDKVRDSATVTRVFGAPITQDGVTVIPVARVGGGGGAGGGRQEGGEKAGEGSGGGFGAGATPVGVFIIKDGQVRWQPVIDYNKIILGGQVVAVVALLTLRAFVRLRARRRS